MFLLDIIEYNYRKDTRGNWSATRSWQIAIYHDTAKIVSSEIYRFFRACFTTSWSIMMWNHDRSWNVVSITIVIDHDLLWCITMWKIQMREAQHCTCVRIECRSSVFPLSSTAWHRKWMNVDPFMVFRYDT